VFHKWEHQSTTAPGVAAALLHYYAPVFPLLLTMAPYYTVPAWNSMGCFPHLNQKDGDQRAAYRCAGLAMQVSVSITAWFS
jgi:hypothetical protein